MKKQVTIFLTVLAPLSTGVAATGSGKVCRHGRPLKLFRLICFLMLMQLPAGAWAQVSFGHAEKFNGGWLFLQRDDSLAAGVGYDDSAWRRLSLPHDWSAEGPLSPSLASCTGYLPGGVGWYRKHFTLTGQSACRFICFEGVYNRSEVYLNGHLLGKRPNGFVSFLYDMTPWLNLHGDNVLAVRVDHSRYADCRWYTGSGIYRDVWMVSAAERHLAPWGTAWRVVGASRRKAVVEVDIAAAGLPGKGLVAEALVRDADGRVVARQAQSISCPAQATVRLTVRDPHWWNLDDPYLYTVETSLRSEGREIDRGEVKMGLRTLRFDADRGFALNGRWMKVKGVCLHHDAGALGAVVPREVYRRRLEELKAIGVNAIRMSHNPQAPGVYDLCDELGLLVMDEASDEWEFPKRKWIEGWNKGKPGYEGSFDFFEEWIDRDVTDMVRRDRNHPSVFLWSIGNEVDYPNDPYSHPVLSGSSISQPMYGGYKPDAPRAERLGKIARRLSADVRAVDRSRPVTGALAGVVMSNETEYPSALDVVGYNYTENRYDADHAAYPKRVIYGSENRHDAAAWHSVADRPFIFGQFLWTGIDYLGESGSWPSRGSQAGLLDLTGNRKARGWFRASLWSDRPVTYIGTYPVPAQGPNAAYVSIDAPDLWNYRDGEMIRVACYTNAVQARLLLNGQPVGEPKARDGQTGVISWDIPYAAGTLRAEGCDQAGRIVSSYEIKTSGRPYALRVKADRTMLHGDGAVAQVEVTVVDDEGTTVRLADNDIRCRLEGPVRLLGLEAGNMTDMTNYRDDHQRAFRGRLMAYVQSTDGKGTARLRFSSPLLEDGEVVINVK